MGRPLKIAKAQAVITLTATAAATDIVTTSANLTNLGIIAGMPFVTASNIGGLVAGTTYWILEVLSATTFTVSATELSANPTYAKVDLSATSAQTIAATVGLVDSGFNNPQGSANTYGIVGGNTAFYGNQVLANVAIGQAGQGTLVVSNNTSILNVVDSAVDVSSYVSVGAWIGVDDNTEVGVVIGNSGLVTQTTVSTESATDTMTLDDSDTLIIDGAIVFGDDIGGLTAGTVYYVESKPSSTSITVSATPGGAALALTDDTVATTATQNCLTLSANSAVNANTSSWVYAEAEAGYIVRQKGKTKYLVKGATSSLIGPCYTANVANAALTANTFNVIGTYANTNTVYMQSLSDYNSEVFPTTVAAGSLSGGTVYTIESVGTTDWTAVGAYANMTGITFVATGAGSGTGTAVVSTVDPDVVGTFNTAEAANTANGLLNPVIEINKG